MGANAQNAALMEALEAQEALKVRGFTSACGPTGSVVLDRWNHVRGVWHYHAGHFFWTDAGSTQPRYRTETLQSALEHTLNVISKV
jgi:hypothetical protein